MSLSNESGVESFYNSKRLQTVGVIRVDGQSNLV